MAALSSCAYRAPSPGRVADGGGFHLDIDALGDQACALLDDAGRVVALNDSAAQLLGQAKQRMLGTRLGSWCASQQEAALRVFCPESELDSTGVLRLLRIQADLDPTPVSLADAVCLAALEANALRKARPFTVSAPELPAMRVPSAWVAAVRAWLTFLVDLDEADPTHIEVEAAERAAGGLELTIRVRVRAGSEPPAAFETAGMKRATATLQELNGQFELSVDYPLVTARLSLPTA